MDKDDVVSTLNDLIETCKDGEKGFTTCAEKVSNPEVKAMLSEGAQRCRESARELQSEVRRLGGDPDTGGSVSGALHRGWSSLKSGITGNDDRAILEEVERGEDVAVASYRNALNEDLPSDIRAIVERQYHGAEKNHLRVRALRDSYPRN
jgi:uncharacterized protein (TIGR02284 family)